MERQEKIARLERQGVQIPAPESVEIGDEVRLENVRGPGTVLHAGSKLFGADLLILPGVRIGYGAPATLEGCAVGRGVKLNGGFFAGAVFLDRVVIGEGAQIRPGSLLEEESNGAHCVGLKQTILFPWVTLGSLINFCDVLMAGGTSRKDHSEVGSSFIHFNYTPFGRHGDKATPSLMGDVPHGVMLRSRRIFLGGQAGLVGPLRVDYGAVLAAGTVYRRDYGPDQLVVGEESQARSLPFNPLRYGRVRSKVEKNLRYIGNLIALWHWYGEVRLRLAGGDDELRALYARGQAAVGEGIEERIQRLAQVAGYMEDSIKELGGEAGRAREIGEQRAFAASWSSTEKRLRGYREEGQQGSEAFRRFLAGLERAAEAGGSYLDVIGKLDGSAREAGTDWLSGIVAATSGLIFPA